MTKQDQIHELAQQILDQNKISYSVSEMAIIMQSQYYNIEALFTFGANYQGGDLEEKILISEQIVSICQGFNRNLSQYPTEITWQDRDHQVTRVNGILNEVGGALEFEKAMKRFRDEPTPANREELNRLMNR